MLFITTCHTFHHILQRQQYKQSALQNSAAWQAFVSANLLPLLRLGPVQLWSSIASAGSPAGDRPPSTLCWGYVLIMRVAGQPYLKASTCVYRIPRRLRARGWRQ